MQLLVLANLPIRAYSPQHGDYVFKWRRERDAWASVEPPNKGHFGDSINSAVVSFVERLSSLRRFKMC